LFEWDGKYLKTYPRGERVFMFDGDEAKFGSGQRYRWEKQSLREYPGRNEVAQWKEGYILLPQSKQRFEFDGVCVRSAGGERIFSIEGAVPLPVVILAILLFS
jgi:hypothetical protein